MVTNRSSAETSPAARPSQMRRPRDMALSLLVLLVPIALVVWFFQYLGEDTEVVVVDPAPAIAEAERAGLSVDPPRGLSESWKSTSAVVRRNDGAVTLRIGYVTPSDGFAQLVESDADPASLLEKELGGTPRPTGTVKVNGEAWHEYPGRNNETALVLMQPERTILVLGTASSDELRTLAGSLG